MTTIALHYADSVIACDGLETDAHGYIIYDECNKLIECENGDIMGCAGDVDLIEIVTFYWGREDFGEHVKSKLRPEHSMSAIYWDAYECTWNIYSLGMMVDGEVHEYQQEIKYNYAVGSGKDYAIAAMDFGCSAEGAVEYAAKRDCGTGGRTRSKMCYKEKGDE